MNPFYQSAFLKALGWSLIDSLWQMGLMWLLITLLTYNGRNFSSDKRYGLSLLALASGSFWFLFSVILNYERIKSGSSFYGVAAFIGNLFSDVSKAEGLYFFMPFISILYLVVTAIFLLRWFVQFRHDSLVLANRIAPAEPEYLRFFEQVKTRLAVPKNIELWFSDKIATPLTYGIFTPLILFPLTATTQLSARQVEALIVHELHHIRRNDYFVNMLLSVVEIIFFFNPFVKLLQSQIKKERENCCDDEVLRCGYDRLEYAEALYIIGRSSHEHYYFAMTAAGKGQMLLLDRVKRMVNRGTSSPSLFRPIAIFAACLLISTLVDRGSKPIAKPPATDRVKPVVFVPAKAPVTTMDGPQTSVEGPQIIEHAIIIEGHTGSENNRPGKKRVTITRLILTAPSVPQLPEKPEEPEEPEAFEEPVIAKFVSSKQEAADYCFIEAPIAGEPVCEPAHPFVPGSTFYFPTHDVPFIGEDGRRTVDL